MSAFSYEARIFLVFICQNHSLLHEAISSSEATSKVAEPFLDPINRSQIQRRDQRKQLDQLSKKQLPPPCSRPEFDALRKFRNQGQNGKQFGFPKYSATCWATSHSRLDLKFFLIARLEHHNPIVPHWLRGRNSPCISLSSSDSAELPPKRR